MRPLFLTGATSVGKSQVALALAKILDGEIISVDSMQVYRGMDIGTAKPSLSERALTPHHLIDVVDLTAEFAVAEFVHLAKEAAQQIVDRRKVPIFCGGTGLYLKGYLHGVGNAPPRNPQVRSELSQLTMDELLREIELKDAVTFQRIDRLNRRRIERAVEVIRLTGRPLSEQRANWTSLPIQESHQGELHEPIGVYALHRRREDLFKRIDQRVELMFDQGLIEETKILVGRGLSNNIAASQALGYKQVLGYLQSEIPLETLTKDVQQRTRKYAKRQETWFRHQLAVEWISIENGESAESTAQVVAEKYLQRTSA